MMISQELVGFGKSINYFVRMKMIQVGLRLMTTRYALFSALTAVQLGPQGVDCAAACALEY